MFESGACLLHLARKSEALMPRDERGVAEVTEWMFAALNSVEMVSVPWWFLGLSNPATNPAGDFPAIRAYVDRACARPAFKRAYDGQMAHFAKAD